MGRGAKDQKRPWREVRVSWPSLVSTHPDYTRMCDVTTTAAAVRYHTTGVGRRRRNPCGFDGRKRNALTEIAVNSWLPRGTLPGNRGDGRFLCVKRLAAIDATRMCTYSRAPGPVSCATLNAISTRAPSRTPMALSMIIIVIFFFYLHMARRYLCVTIAGGPRASYRPPPTIHKR